MTVCRKIISLLLIVFWLSACGEYPCTSVQLNYALVGFSDTESENFIIRKFDPQTGQLIDTVMISESNPVRFSRSEDTLQMTAYLSTSALESKYDYELFFPVAGKLFTITDIQEEQLYGRSGIGKKAGCSNTIERCRVNGIYTSVSNLQVYLQR